ncbi:hypothetical protein KDA_76690 [Dictyobacter alpinus]|uniref:Uncharacterized protein n=1 Tax=Dictyobacter alpinus TaxID=2014873 RepID=A0A402BLD8_9CHLR|nr:hypothetical protein [Dictyobacter alpinus]GCE32185.1 hypothetical protein KDA_76690 [Dictyobacter alpinus]
MYNSSMTIEDILHTPSFEAKYEAVTSELPFLLDLISGLADGREYKVGVKEKATAAQKILRKLPVKPDYTEENLGDLIRGNIIASDTEDAQYLLSQLQKVATLVALDNYAINPTAWGYNGINTNILSPNGHTVEVQIHTPETRAVQKALHPLYTEWRNEVEVPLWVFEEARRLADEARKNLKAAQ